MEVTKEMLNAYYDENFSHMGESGRCAYWAGIAAYAHLSSPGSEKWRKEHGFKTTEQ